MFHFKCDATSCLSSFKEMHIDWSSVCKLWLSIFVWFKYATVFWWYFDSSVFFKGRILLNMLIYKWLSIIFASLSTVFCSEIKFDAMFTAYTCSNTVSYKPWIVQIKSVEICFRVYDNFKEFQHNNSLYFCNKTLNTKLLTSNFDQRSNHDRPCLQCYA